MADKDMNDEGPLGLSCARNDSDGRLVTAP